MHNVKLRLPSAFCKVLIFRQLSPYRNIIPSVSRNCQWAVSSKEIQLFFSFALVFPHHLRPHKVKRGLVTQLRWKLSWFSSDPKSGADPARWGPLLAQMHRASKAPWSWGCVWKEHPFTLPVLGFLHLCHLAGFLRGWEGGEGRRGDPPAAP